MKRQMADDLVITDETSAGDLRKAYEKAKARAEAAEKQAQTLLAEKRATTVADLLEAKGAPAGAAKFYDGEADEASVSAWLEENKELFPIKSATSSNATTTTSAAGSPTESSAPGAPVDPNILAAQLVALATAQAGQNDVFGQTNLQGAPTFDVDRMNQTLELMRTAPRTPEGYQQLVNAGIFPANTGI